MAETKPTRAQKRSKAQLAIVSKRADEVYKNLLINGLTPAVAEFLANLDMEVFLLKLDGGSRR